WGFFVKGLLAPKEELPRTDDISYQIVQSVEQSLPKSQYALYDNNEGFYIVKMHTPGVQQKEQVQIDVSYDDRTITIIAEN
ncbi:6035_t:CDS:2, partial [Rhizophagus irregularis]